MPRGTPISSEIDTDTMPASNEARVPQITRDSTSRPISSVPSQYCALGALRMAAQLAAIGSSGAIHGANRASTMNATTTARPTSAPCRRLRRNQARRQGPDSGTGAATRWESRTALMSASAEPPQGA